MKRLTEVEKEGRIKKRGDGGEEGKDGRSREGETLIRGKLL